MAARTLARGIFQKEHDKVAHTSLPVVGTNTYTFLDYGSQNIAIKTEFSASTLSCTVRILWTAKDGTTTFLQQTAAVNSGLQANTLETNYFHGVELTFSSHGAKTCRVDILTPVNTGSMSVWVAAF